MLNPHYAVYKRRRFSLPWKFQVVRPSIESAKQAREFLSKHEAGFDYRIVEAVALKGPECFPKLLTDAEIATWIIIK